MVVVEENNRNVVVVEEESNRNVVVEEENHRNVGVVEEESNRNVVVVVVEKNKLSVGSMRGRYGRGWKKIYNKMRRRRETGGEG